MDEMRSLMIILALFLIINSCLSFNNKISNFQSYRKSKHLKNLSPNDPAFENLVKKLYDNNPNAIEFMSQVKSKFDNHVFDSMSIPNLGDTFTSPYNNNDIIVGVILFVFIPTLFVSTFKKQHEDTSIVIDQTTPYLNGEYNPSQANSYFRDKPFKVISRSNQLFSSSLNFIVKLLFDYLDNKLTDPTTESLRAQELTSLLTKLGPTFIKVGQSLSIRSDLLRPAYLSALSKLQDQVPPFDSKIAVSILEEELKAPINTIFLSGISPQEKVIAAASLGQVYKARLLSNNLEVAVKIQRPNIIEEVALDMYILRLVAPVVKRIAGLQSDLVGIIDDWGTGFVNELDYLKEGANAEYFTNSINKTRLNGVVFAPRVYSQISTKRVLVSEWVQGERIDRAKSRGLTDSCSVAMNTYLTMMLETGVLHCDPHPGNLLVTPDGRLCILDWGLVTTLEPDLQLTFIEHIAHLTSKDYDKVPQDLVKLGFIPTGKEAVALESGVVSVLSEVYTEFAGGGGAAKINVNNVISKLSGLSDTYGNIFQVPPYFAYIAKAFGVLEGIGLSSDPNYAIVGECLPYISQRLLSDTNPRTGDALKSFIFGVDKDRFDRVIDSDRVELLVKGYSNYASSTLSNENSDSSSSSSSTANIVPGGNSKKVSLSLDKIEYLSDQIIELLFTSTGEISEISSRANRTPLQQLLIDEISKLIGALSRQQWFSLRQRSGRLSSGRSLLGSIVDPLGLFQFSPLIAADEYDEKVLTSAKNILFLINDLVDKNVIPFELENIALADLIQFSSDLSVKLWKKRKDVANFGLGIASQLIENSISRLDNTKNRNFLKASKSTSADFNKVFTSDSNIYSQDVNEIINPNPTPSINLSSNVVNRKGENSRLELARQTLANLKSND